MNRALIIFVILFFVSYSMLAQTQDSSKVNISWDGYIETYHTIAQPINTNNNTVSDLLYNHSRVRELNINMAMLRANMSNEYIRATAAVMAGTYARYNLSHEPGVLQNIYELHAGVKLSRAHQLWLEAGVFESYIGYETPLGTSSLTLSKSLAAENTPYYLSGARVQYESNNNKWLVAFYYLNGWQQMFNNFNSYKPSGGVNIQYRISDKWMFNYSNFTGNVVSYQAEVIRLYHNFYATWKPNKRLEMRALFDIGTDYRTANDIQRWVVMNAMARFQFAKQWYAAGRVEYYQHHDGLLMLQNLPVNQFRNVAGASVSIDKQLYKNVLLRNEARMLHTTHQPDLAQPNNPFVQWMHYVSLCVRL